MQSNKQEEGLRSSPGFVPIRERPMKRQGWAVSNSARTLEFGPVSTAEETQVKIGAPGYPRLFAHL